MNASRPRPFILTSTDHGSMIVNRLDFHQLPTGISYGVGHQLLTTGAYDREEIELVKSVLRNCRKSNGDGIVALDCGANIGVHTLEMAQEMNNWGKVIAFEAQERLFYALCGNIALNNLFNAQAYFIAVGERVENMMIPRPNYLRPASFGSLEFRRNSSTEFIGQNISYALKDLTSIPCISLDSLSLVRVDFIKIDVEGMEMDVLRGAKETISKFHPVVLVEWIKSGQDVIVEFFKTFDYNSISIFGGNLLCQKILEI